MALPIAYIKSKEDNLESANDALTPDIVPSEWWDGNKPGTFFHDVYQCGDNSKEGFFNDLELNLIQRTQRECDLIQRFLELKSGSSIIDCPCGYGRHSIELARKDYRITGVDLSKDYIQNAKYESEKAKLNCRFRQADMRNLPKDLSGFDACINMFFSFGFFSDAENLNTLENFASVLKTGGRLLIHTDVNPDRLVDASYRDRPLRTLYNNARLKVTEYYDEKTRRLVGSWKISDANNRTVERFYSVRIYSHEEMVSMMQNAGFCNLQILSAEDSQSVDIPQEIFYIATKT
jgi:cyclopropane fatty-acyl-phospholipid synthase-like methyltransferase